MERETSSHDPVRKMLMLAHDMPASTTSSVRPANHPSRMLAMIASAASASSLKDHLQWSNHYSGTWGVHQGHGLLNIANPNPSPAAIATAHAHQLGGGMPAEAGEAAALQMLPLPDPPPAAAAAAAPNSREVGPHLAIGGPDLAGARAVVADEAAATALYFHLTNNNRGGCAAATCTGATVSPMKRSFYTMFSDASDDAADELDTCIVDCTHVEKKRRLTVQQLRALESNFDKENKLEPERKMQLAHELGLQPRQVAVWFQNRRARWKNKQLEKDYDQLKLEYDTLMFERDNLQSQVQLLTTKLQAFEPPGPDGDDIDMHHSNRLKVEEIPASLAPVSGTSGTSAARLQPPSSSAFHHVPLRNTAEEDEATPVDVHARAAESGKGESFLQLPGPGSSGFALSPANSGDLETGMALTEGSTTCATGHSGEVGTMATLADNTSMMGYDMSQVSSPVIKVSSPSDSSMVSTTSLSNTSHVQQPTAQDIHLVAAVDLPSLAVTHVIASEASVISATTFPPCVPDSANAMPTFDSIPADHPPMATQLEALDAATSGPGQHLLAANATSTEAHHHVLHVPYAACPNSQTDHIHHSQLQLQADTTHDLTPGPVSAAVMNQASTSGHGVGVPSRSVVSADNFPFSFADPAASARALQLQGLRRNLSSPSLHQVNHNLCQLNLCPISLRQAGPGSPPALDIAPPCACDGPSGSSLSEPATNMHATGMSLMRELSGSSMNIVDPSPAASASRGVLVNVAGGYAGPRPVGHAHGPLLSSTYQFMKSSHLNNLAKLVIPSMSQAGHGHGHGLPLNMGAVTAVSRTVTDYASPQPAAGSMSNVRIFHVPPAAGTGGDANGGGGQPTSTEPLHRPQIPPMQAQPPPQPQAFAHHHPFQQLTYQAAKVEPEPDFVPGLLPQSAGQSSSSQFDLVDSRSGGLPCNWWEV